MHSKMIFVRKSVKSGTRIDSKTHVQARHEAQLQSHDGGNLAAGPNTDEMSAGWAYVGSANLSESAW